ncbi:hypothetical protein HK57_00042 [Aspergillus ustus]|uniref:Serine hydrolase domain-containing protein n=1 Tax=Aspergillus ustus TaxID=40382 RepID=A0A0C1E5N9_ASPUT|nr:hypothetical protein HK57_00042 [Aspergillus ustus]
MSGPFYNWYDGLSSSQVREAHELVTDVIEDEGPFDGVIGFSQGASLAISMLYHHEICHPNRPPPFRFAIFFCAVLSISPDAMFNSDVIRKYARYYHKQAKQNDDAVGTMEELAERVSGGGVSFQDDDDDKTTTAQKPSRLRTHHHRAMLLLPGQKAALVKELFALVRQLVDIGADHDQAAQTQWKTRGGLEGFPRVYHPLINTQRISIPTVHIIGRSDPLRRQSELQARLCSKSVTRIVEFEGAHKVPHKMNDLQGVLKAVEWAMRVAQMH